MCSPCCKNKSFMNQWQQGSRCSLAGQNTHRWLQLAHSFTQKPLLLSTPGRDWTLRPASQHRERGLRDQKTNPYFRRGSKGPEKCHPLHTIWLVSGFLFFYWPLWLYQKGGSLLLYDKEVEASLMVTFLSFFWKLWGAWLLTCFLPVLSDVVSLAHSMLA